jgi:hypothetical protein
MTLEIQELAEAMGTQWNGRARTAAGWSVDTRTQNAGDVYFALRGPNHDGHDFVAAAMEKGAAAVVVGSGMIGLLAMQAAKDGLYLEARDGSVKRLMRRAWGAQNALDVRLPLEGSASILATRADVDGAIVGHSAWTRARGPPRHSVRFSRRRSPSGNPSSKMNAALKANAA